MHSHLKFWLFFFAVLIIQSAHAQIEFLAGNSYSYLKGSQAGSLSADWILPGFDDSSWQVGNAPIRYGDGSGGTEITDMQNNYTTLFLRSEFTATGASGITNLYFTIDFDDGFVVWINGNRAVEQNAPLSINSASTATELRESGVENMYTISADDISLVEGINTIAVAVLNEKLSSSDIYFDMAISATSVYSDSLGIDFSHSSGFYNSPFTLTISTPDTGAEILYTLDGSNPQTSPTAQQGSSPVNVSINPASTTNRPKTPGVVVRTSLGSAGFLPSYPQSRTFIFLNDVEQQAYPGGGWPDYDVNGQYVDLEMDPEIVNDSRYSDKIDDALKDIPTLSVITSIDNMWDETNGIYVNAWGHGREWERDCNVELIYPDGSAGFEVNAGIRIRGGWSRHNDFPKHSFRLFFRSVYGDSKLYYPLFGDEGTDRYDKIDLRTAQNYAWSNGDSRNTMVREVFSRDLQRDMGQPYTRSRYYHLYINGMYWGVFQTQERSEARYAADYFGGDNDDYDVVKVSTTDWNYTVEATDGELDGWREVYNALAYDLSSNERYFALEGKSADGIPVKGGKVLVDIDNLIDYMLTIFYTGNFDAPTSAFGGNKGANNFYAIYDRTDDSKGFIFLNHDAEHSLMVEPASPGIGLYEDRVNLGTRNDGDQMEVNSFNSFHPQWLHEKLTANAEYRRRFADRAFMYLNGEGVLTPEKNRARFNQRVAELETAIIAESARWGDGKGSGPYTRDNHWFPEIQEVQNDFFGPRNGILKDQLRDAGLYNDLEAPILAQGSELFDHGSYNLSSSEAITLENPNSGGTIYYTLTGKDPRRVGGDVHYDAKSSAGTVTFDAEGSMIITARVLHNGQWSALRKVNLLSTNDNYSKLKVTELHYHPLDVIVGTDTTSGKSYEFIEFKNTGEYALDLSGCVLDSAVYCEFPENSVLAPGQFFVAAAKPSKFYDTYGRAASANFSQSFSNGGEEVQLFDPSGNLILRFHYLDDSPWPLDPDGNGPSMVAEEINPTGLPDDPYYWRTSMFDGGSPFRDDVPLGIDDNLPAPAFTAATVYPNPTSGLVNIVLADESDTFSTSISLYNLSGTLIYQGGFEDGNLNLQALNMPKGLYFIKITTEKSQETHKLIYR